MHKMIEVSPAPMKKTKIKRIYEIGKDGLNKFTEIKIWITQKLF